MLDSNQTVLIEDVQIPVGDGALSGRIYRPVVQPETVVVVNSATGVPRDYYKHFAQWLASDRDIACLIYDYREFGHSKSGPQASVENFDGRLGVAGHARRTGRDAPTVPVGAAMVSRSFAWRDVGAGAAGYRQD